MALILKVAVILTVVIMLMIWPLPVTFTLPAHDEIPLYQIWLWKLQQFRQHCLDKTHPDTQKHGQGESNRHPLSTLLYGVCAWDGEQGVGMGV